MCEWRPPLVIYTFVASVTPGKLERRIEVCVGIGLRTARPAAATDSATLILVGRLIDRVAQEIYKAYIGDGQDRPSVVE